ncbi:hypothetical protein WME73_14075 [Sorangium sp. So ce302]|uniref:hypothetical protein n=1 Tax=unclassified Sorangium TaxID=2621164 RepID=UPI003F6431F4
MPSYLRAATDAPSPAAASISPAAASLSLVPEGIRNFKLRQAGPRPLLTGSR